MVNSMDDLSLDWSDMGQDWNIDDWKSSKEASTGKEVEETILPIHPPLHDYPSIHPSIGRFGTDRDRLFSLAFVTQKGKVPVTPAERAPFEKATSGDGAKTRKQPHNRPDSPKTCF
ncbi:hypothetical protein CYMTET_24292 [Cymbomonas tetramitiformis]|uniref:Uncharacterized protein n=1 Tax=Cymbomonas tetramitiformis TaxID=36881 RepID=A0AAE0L031_9CHLO|nr:hypothetical protein CYMTET_24292 [Cymbomonas tetramitiformis]